MRCSLFGFVSALALLLPSLYAGGIDAPSLERQISALTKGFDGRVGACVQDNKHQACTRPDESFSLQSVMKLLVGVAVLDAVDNKGWRLDEQVTIQKEDLSVFVQPVANLIGPSGFRTTIGDLVRRAIIESDSAATDFVIARLGGPSTVQAVLRRKGISGVRIDRDERRLQTEIIGITWKPEYVDAAVFDRAIQAVPEATREKAYSMYQTDPRDTASPKGMATFLLRLAHGELLSKSSTEFVLKAMEECKTFPDRLKAGTGPGWKIAHKTGTSGSWKGLTVATNDVGILTAPDGTQLSIVVFVADTKASLAERAAIMAKISAAAVANYR